MAGTGRIYVTAVRAVGDINLTHQYDVDVRFDIAFDWGGYNAGGAGYNISCDGQNQGGSSGFNVGSGGGSWVWTNIGGTKTFRITMPTSGQSKTIGFSATINTGISPPTISASGSYTLGAVVWEHTVSYNANGGSGAPGNQTKVYGAVLTLSSAKPTNPGYIFMGWATSSAGNVAYAAGDRYEADSDITLYAVWKIAYIKPAISDLAAVRCVSNGTASNDGTYIKVSGKWSVDTTINSGNKATNVKIEYRKATSDTWTTASSTNPAAASGTIASVIGGGNISTGSVYFVRVTVTDSGGNKPETVIVAAQFRPFDVWNEGETIAFGGPASDKQGYEFYQEARFSEGIVCNEQYFDVDGTPVKVADFVIAQGTSGIWAYRKWNSGIAEAWGISTGTTDAGGIYHASLSHPFPYAENPVIAATAYVAGDWTARIGYVNNTSLTSMEFYVHGFGNHSACARLYVIGRWK